MTAELYIKVWHLKKWDKAKHWSNWELVVFQKMDWMYAQWKTESWEIKRWQSNFYKKNEDWIYIWQ